MEEEGCEELDGVAVLAFGGGEEGEIGGQGLSERCGGRPLHVTNLMCGARR